MLPPIIRSSETLIGLPQRALLRRLAELQEIVAALTAAVDAAASALAAGEDRDLAVPFRDAMADAAADTLRDRIAVLQSAIEDCPDPVERRHARGLRAGAGRKVL